MIIQVNVFFYLGHRSITYEKLNLIFTLGHVLPIRVCMLSWYMDMKF